MRGLVYSGTFSAVAVSAAQDVFELVTPATTRIELCEITLGQYSDAGDAAAELLSAQIITGYTVSGSGGTSVTPGKWQPWSRTSAVTCEANNTTVANTGTATILVSDAFNIQAGWVWRPPQPTAEENERLFVDVSTRLVVRITVPADAVTMNGTIKWKEIGLY